MIPRSHLTKIADGEGVDAKTVERDYVLAHVLATISEQPDAKSMIFKGGTALRLCYFDDYRYSADLDFSLIDGLTVERAIDIVKAALGLLVDASGFSTLDVSEDGKRIDYVGPLGGARSLKLDLSADELVEDVTTRPLITRYTDQPVAEVHVYTLAEAAAEKLRCVIQRLQARDFYDLHELLVMRKVIVDEVWPVFERKARHKNIEPTRFAETFEKRVPQWKSRWSSEMSEHVGGELPPFDGIERALRRELRERLRNR